MEKEVSEKNISEEKEVMFKFVLATIQKICLESMRFATENYQQITDVLANPDKEGEASLVDLVAGVVANLKSYEILLFKLTREFVLEECKQKSAEEGIPYDTFLFLKEQAEEITTLLMLINRIVTPRELNEIYRPEKVARAIAMFEEAKKDAAIEGGPTVDEAIANLKASLEKIREKRKEDGITQE